MVRVDPYKLAVLLAATGMTQAEFSARSKVDQSRLTKLLRTGGCVRAKTAYNLACGLGKPPSAFLATTADANEYRQAISAPPTESFFG